MIGKKPCPGCQGPLHQGSKQCLVCRKAGRYMATPYTRYVRGANGGLVAQTLQPGQGIVGTARTPDSLAHFFAAQQRRIRQRLASMAVKKVTRLAGYADGRRTPFEVRAGADTVISKGNCSTYAMGAKKPAMS